MKTKPDMRHRYLRDPLPYPVQQMQQRMCASIFNVQDFTGDDGLGWSATINLQSNGANSPIHVQTIVNSDPPDYDDKLMSHKQALDYIKKWVKMVEFKIKATGWKPENER